MKTAKPSPKSAGRRAARRAIAKGKPLYIESNGGPPPLVHPELGVPTRQFVVSGLRAPTMDVAAFADGYNEAIREAHDAGELEDLRVVAMGPERLRTLLAASPPLRLLPGGVLRSPDGQHELRSSPKRKAIELDGRFIAWVGADVEYAFTADGHLLSVDHGLGLATATNLARQAVVGTLPVGARAGSAETVERRLREARERGTSCGSLDGDGRHIERRDVRGLTLTPGDGVERFTLEHCEVYQCTAGAPRSLTPA